MFLIWPFLAMLETFRASDPRHHRGTDWQLLPASRLVLAWWGLYVVSFFLVVSSPLVMQFSEDLDTKYGAAWAGLFGVLLQVVVLVMQVRIVQRLTNLQESRAGSFASVPFAAQARSTAVVP